MDSHEEYDKDDVLNQPPMLISQASHGLSVCGNPACTQGWRYLLKRRDTPVFEGRWSCSESCTIKRVEAALHREMHGRQVFYSTTLHRHRVPLGLLMLEKGWITADQLRRALEAQRQAGKGRLGNWLIKTEGIGEHLVTRALSLQWSCPVLPVDIYDASHMAAVMPRLLAEGFNALPLRIVAGRILYLGFEDRQDPALALGLERMLGLRVETGIVMESQFISAHAQMMRSSFPQVRLASASNQRAMARLLTHAILETKPVASRLVRIHDCLWMRMWKKPQRSAAPETANVEDVICTLGINQAKN